MPDSANPADNDDVAELPTLYEKVAYDVHAEATKGALKSIDDSAAAISTAAFSIATAYGALVALATPKTRPTALWFALPIFGFIVAALVALWGRSRTLTLISDASVGVVTSRVQKHLRAKQLWVRGAVVVLALSVAWAAWTVVRSYQPPASETQPESENNSAAAKHVRAQGSQSGR